MAKPSRTIKNPFAPAATGSSPPFFHLSPLSPYLLFSPKRTSPRFHLRSPCVTPQPAFALFILSLLVLSVTFWGISFLAPEDTDPGLCSLISPSSSVLSYSPNPNSNPELLASLAMIDRINEDDEDSGKKPVSLKSSAIAPLPVRGHSGNNVTEEEREFWRQPDGKGFRPCLDFGIQYRRKSARISKERRRFLVVVASGGLNQQRNQIVDAVVIARILEAALVVPVLQVNPIWGDESEFPDIFDVEHFKKTLRADVRVVNSLPSTHLMSRQSVENQIPYDISPSWIRARFSKQLDEEGLLVLKGLDSKLSKNLPLDLQKLRCKVAFHALRFATPIQRLGNKLARRMWIEGPYVALHMRLEKDVWVRTGCLTGLGPEYDTIIAETRALQPEYLTGKLNISRARRRLAGLCPMNASEMARLLKALGAPSTAPVYVAGGEPFGGGRALRRLMEKFPNLVTKETLAQKGELTPYANKSSALAAIDYIVSLSSNVFLPSHGGNMARAMQGHRAYTGHLKFVKPNKKAILEFLDDESIAEEELGNIIRKLHRKSQGQPEPRNNRRDRDPVAYPVPECMCNRRSLRLF